MFRNFYKEKCTKRKNEKCTFFVEILKVSLINTRVFLLRKSVAMESIFPRVSNTIFLNFCRYFGIIRMNASKHKLIKNNSKQKKMKSKRSAPQSVAVRCSGQLPVAADISNPPRKDQVPPGHLAFYWTHTSVCKLKYCTYFFILFVFKLFCKFFFIFFVNLLVLLKINL